MTRSDSLSRPAPVPEIPPEPAGRSPAAALGLGGVWPPPRPERPAAGRARDDPPTVPLPALGGPRGSPAGPRAVEPPPQRRGRVEVLLRRLAPQSWRGARVDPGRPGATALALVAAAAAVVAAAGVWFERPRAEPVSALPAVGVVAESGVAASPAPAAPSPAPAVPLVVAVSGKVQRPGLVEVPEGARVADVLDAAGGALPGTDLAGLNLARRVADGEQVAVGVPPAPDAGGAEGPAGSPDAPVGKVDLNAATDDQLDALPGVGPVTAQRILEWRARNGRFSRVEQLREVEGIGERRFAQLRELVTV